ncbi:M13 family metallopeptidase [Sphingosinicellaceae bacterium]|nr:M13 family metallopeptidase [Sphingosinicellaceae bacterium]
MLRPQTIAYFERVACGDVAVIRTTLAILALVTTPVSAAPVYPPFGLDLAAPDLSVRPGDDFFEASNGGYLKRLEIPADQVLAGKRFDMTQRIEDRLHGLLEDAAKHAPAEPTTLEGKVGAMYAAFMDEAAIESSGAAPIRPELKAIQNARDRGELAALMGENGSSFYASPFAAGIDQDLKQPGRYAVFLNQTGMLLPDRDYYSKAEFQPHRDAYLKHAATILAAAGWPDPHAAAAAALAFETKLAEASWTMVQQRDLTVQYNPMTPAALAAYAPGFDWQAYLRGAGLGSKTRLIVMPRTAFPKLAALVGSTPLEVLKDWLAFRAADAAAPYLAHAFADSHFELHGRMVAGQLEQKPRWKRAILAVSGGDCAAEPDSCFGTLDWAVGELYSARYFPTAAKAMIEALVADLKAAFRHRIEKLDWMGEATRTEALRKLDTYVIKVGFPDRPRDYSSVRIRRGDLLGDVRRATEAEWAFQRARSDGPVDRDEWIMTPQTNDAYNGRLRDVVFPAGILQAPMFDAEADPAINYGAIGGVIAHEMTHGFDDQGRAIDAAGALRDWWTPADAAAFKARAAVLGAQYATYQPVPGFHIDPDLTMGENLADLGGLSIALDAYRASLHGRPPPVIGGLTGDQRVFLGWSQVWAGKARPETIRKQVSSDPHSYRRYRVNGVVRNIDGWYAAFGIKPGDALYLAPAERARIW